jgi:hypothetical protein
MAAGIPIEVDLVSDPPLYQRVAPDVERMLGES